MVTFMILDIHKYLMKENNMILKCLGLLTFTGLTTLSSVNPLSTTLPKFISMNNQ